MIPINLQQTKINLKNEKNEKVLFIKFIRYRNDYYFMRKQRDQHANGYC